ncbi:dual specificity protein phosphatase 18 [Erinaceus europaeus]|uniref:Dual specificity protein phosphatase 18 n=1 Tax=Erinaceus europaeus TaxID=9365 RepID=A0A1S3A4T1_ERIEU|nr:dual specificity protein phosphatase 18 [Erinaceus europaeus]
MEARAPGGVEPAQQEDAAPNPTPPTSPSPLPLPAPPRRPSVSGLSRVTHSLYLSGGAAARSQALLAAQGITAVVRVHAAAEAVAPRLGALRCLRVPVADSPSARLCDFFDVVADFIHDEEQRRGRTLLHCGAGVSRSPALCLAYLMRHQGLSLRDAHAWARACRPIIRPNLGFWEQLVRYELQLLGRNSVHMVSSAAGTVPDLYEPELRLLVPL